MATEQMRDVQVPLGGKIGCMFLSLTALAVIAIATLRRVQGVKVTKTLPLTFFLVVAVYGSSFLFVFLTAVYRDVGINNSKSIRFGYINTDGVCIIGVKKIALIPLISFDVAVNAYLTVLFLIAIRRLYSYREDDSNVLRNVALRAFFGSCMMLTVTVINLTVLMLLDGEPSWICFLSCNLDVLFTVCILHWITKTDKTNLSRYYAETLPAAATKTLWYQPPYASHTSWHSGGGIGGIGGIGIDKPQRLPTAAATPRSNTSSNNSVPSTTTTTKKLGALSSRLSIDLGGAGREEAGGLYDEERRLDGAERGVGGGARRGELDGETLRYQGDSSDSVSVGGLPEEVNEFP
ncbi:hypothetical protein UCRNP2_9395 [Neofusicoccum parvum UCRNP2]|uniref:Uncharacterized protein n=1 Tax=Botryosphaeria parva (strain UCR-NP2) TaxID=1287680 RepID=R1GDC8_BOTPV|nr:hypothetical protein UCRNP2_9395 [Neofusicoccum parvum UCRNP2]